MPEEKHRIKTPILRVWQDPQVFYPQSGQVKMRGERCLNSLRIIEDWRHLAVRAYRLFV